VATARDAAYAGQVEHRLVGPVLGLLVVAGCSSGGTASGKSDRPPAVPVSVAAVVRRDAPVTLHAIGNVQAFSTVSIRAQVEGQIASVHFAEGEEVKKGDLLFMVDPRSFEAALHQAEATLARDRAEAEHARVEAGRFARLVAAGVVSADEHDRARSQADALAAAVQAEQAAVERARIDRQYCEIHAPIDGRIGQTLVHLGNVVKANETVLAVINQVRPVYVEFSVPQQELPGIRTHMGSGTLPVEATIPDTSVAPVAGELRFVNNAVDTTTGTVLLKAAFANDDETLWPGQFVNVAVRLATESDVLMIPARAVQAGQQGAYVFVVRADRTVEARPVSVGHAVETDVIVREGLAPGEQVVTDGQIRLAPGVAVDVRGDT